MQTFTVDKKQKLSEFLLDKYNGTLSYSKFNMLLRKKEIKVNGVRVKQDVIVNLGDLVESYYQKKKMEIDVVYKDENLLVCNKPQGVTSENYFNEVLEQYPTAIFTHRLDRNTSGIILFALNLQAYSELFNAFKKRAFEKYYHCLVSGCFEQKSGELNDYLLKDEKQSLVKIYNKQVKGSLPICTRYEEVACGEQSSVLKVELVTGRTHQIRAHLAYYGHFIIGDGKYGKESVNKQFKQSAQLLTASSITLHFDSKSKLNYLDKKCFFIDNKSIFDKLK